MSAAILVRDWDWSRSITGRASPVAYPSSVAILILALVVAACSGESTRPNPITLETVPYQTLPQPLANMKLPIRTAAVTAIADRLPTRISGQQLLPNSGWLADDRFVARWGDLTAWGTQNGVAGTLPSQITIRHVDALGPHAASSGAAAIIDDANQAAQGAGRVDIGRDGPIVWSRRTDTGYTVAWGRIDSPWIYVATASNEPTLTATLHAFRATTGIHGGTPTTVR